MTVFVIKTQCVFYQVTKSKSVGSQSENEGSIQRESVCDLRWKIGTGSEFIPRSSVLSCQHDSTNDTYGAPS